MNTAMNIRLCQVRCYIFLSLFFTFLACSGEGKKDFLDPRIFRDGLTPATTGLFTLLDDYPALKAFFIGKEPEQFNLRLGQSLEKYPASQAGMLRAIERATLSPDVDLRGTLFEAAEILQRLRTENPEAYHVLLNYLEKMRDNEHPVLRAITPINQRGLEQLYISHTERQMQEKFEEIATKLGDPDTIETLKDVEYFLIKVLYGNSDIRNALEDILVHLSSPQILGNPRIPGSLVSAIGSIGDAMGERSGFGSQITARTTMVRTVQNISNHYYSGGNVYDINPAYSDPVYPSDLDIVIPGLYEWTEKLIIPDTTLQKDSRPFADLLMEYMATMNFASDLNPESFDQMIAMDLRGRSRSAEIQASPTSSLEALFFLISLADTYGFTWDTDAASSSPTITSSNNGILTLGDAMHAMGSFIKGDPTLSLVAFLNRSESQELVEKNGQTFAYNINAPALSFLQGQSRGAISSMNDPVYNRTLPFMMNWIRRVLFSGYGPYYNQNRTDTAGNIRTLDDSLYRDSSGNDLIYQSNWHTDRFRIEAKKGSTPNWVGLGGIENPADFQGTRFAVEEIPVSARAVESDEEAFYKNFQWLLHEKRFVLVVPVQAVLGDSGVEHAVYLIIVANGLSGLLNAKPYCEIGFDECSRNDNGRWQKAGIQLKPDYQTPSSTLQWSSEPGDSTIFVEAWGYGLTGSDNFGFANEVLYTTLYDSILFPVPPSLFHGAIPPALAHNAEVLERLSFLTEDRVTAANTENHWNQRNEFLPILAALIATIDSQVDTDSDNNYSSPVNSYEMITELASYLNRPYLLQGTEPVSGQGGIDMLRIAGFDDSNFSMRSRSMDTEDYYPNPNLRSFLSILTEHTVRAQDGLLKLIARTDLFQAAATLLVEIGRPEAAQARADLFTALQALLAEQHMDWHSEDPNKLNIRYYVREFSETMGQYAHSRSSSITSIDWDDVRNQTTFVYDYLSNRSAYSIVPTVRDTLALLGSNPPERGEIEALFDTILVLFINDDGSARYQITELLSNEVAALLHSMAPHARSLVGGLDGLAESGGFFNYLENGHRNPHNLKTILLELEMLLKADIIQSRTEDETNILYAAGTLMKAFADIKEKGQGIGGVGGYWFQDHWNKTQSPDGAFDWLNLIMSNKVRR